jgi:hypothetical protein
VLFITIDKDEWEGGINRLDLCKEQITRKPATASSAFEKLSIFVNYSIGIIMCCRLTWRNSSMKMSSSKALQKPAESASGSISL